MGVRRRRRDATPAIMCKAKRERDTILMELFAAVLERRDGCARGRSERRLGASSTQMRSSEQNGSLVNKVAGIVALIVGVLLTVELCLGAPANPSQIPSIFKPHSTPPHSILRFSLLILTVTGLIFSIVFSLIVYSLVKYRRRNADDVREPPQVYGSNQIELAWTVIPINLRRLAAVVGVAPAIDRKSTRLNSSHT